MQTFMSWLGILRRFGLRVGPYLMLEMLLPGGTLLALLFFLCRRKPDIETTARRAFAVVIGTLASVFEQRILVPVPRRVTVPVPKAGPAERL
jgi:hypothetical protein